MSKIATEKVILGIDPGTNILGYGVIEARDKNPRMITMGVIELGKYRDHYLKLQKIFERIVSLIDHYHPDELAIEAPFYGKNVQSMLKLGRAQGVAMAAALSRSMPIFEYAPLRIKQSITGRGNASKEQVALFLQQYLDLKEMPKYLDATDALATAVCHFFQSQNPVSLSNASSWKEFIRKNPGRVKS
jgi:crossover junction endodeoxyribonuclease RuvC